MGEADQRVGEILADFREDTDYEKYGGAPLIGHAGSVFICHGRSSETAMANAIGAAADYVRHGVAAGARALDSAEAISPLQSMAHVFNDAMALALEYTQAWMNRTGEGPDTMGSARVVTDFGPTEKDTVDLDALKAARDRGDISREKYLTELQRRDVLPDDFNFEENAAELERALLDTTGAAPPEIDPEAEV